MLSLCSNPYLALSFGKDSVAMLDLVREQAPNVQCLFLASEETFYMGNYDELLGHYRAAGVCVEVVEMNHLDHDFDAGRNNEFQQPRFFDGWDGVFMGLRIEECKARRISLLRKENNEAGSRIMQYKSGRRAGMYRCCPMADWTGFEVMLYVQEKGLRVLDCYTDYTVRSSAQMPYGQGATNALFRVQQTSPERYNRLITLIPELKIYG